MQLKYEINPWNAENKINNNPSPFLKKRCLHCFDKGIITITGESLSICLKSREALYPEAHVCHYESQHKGRGDRYSHSLPTRPQRRRKPGQMCIITLKMDRRAGCLQTTAAPLSVECFPRRRRMDLSHGVRGWRGEGVGT